ncbi:taurine catabolism dioxygenase [Fusarium sp. NRRL 52700]|nr:taurine catabolism dioxygenase [Fusarium sp. NRRL 52700]
MAVSSLRPVIPFPFGSVDHNVSAKPLTTAVDRAALETSSKILDIIGRYRMRQDDNLYSQSDESTLKFIALIYTHVKAGKPVPMCLPAFPFKSPNSTSKTLGKLPDKGEEIALAHLNGLCSAIGDVYAPGARLTIISDGLVYNDLLGVPDRDVWAYGETLRSMAAEKEFHNISFARLRDLVEIDLPKDLEEMTYVANASNFRRALLNTFSKPGWSWDEVRQSEDQCMTYRGYIKFLQTDLQTVYPVDENRSKSRYKRGIEYIAKQMMARGDAFANAVRQKYPDHVRLSIHPSTGAVKLSISLLPTEQLYTTPWHCSVAYRLDGTIRTGMRSEFDNDESLELVYDNGRPSHYREKSPLLSWAEDKGGIVVDPMYPAGLIIRPANGAGSLTLDDIDTKKVRALSEINSPVVLKGFVKKPNRDRFIDFSHRFGTPLPWKFGLLLEVKDRGQDARGLNNVLSAEPMPFHYDGLFKVVKQADENGNETMVSTPPQFQLFQGATSSPRDTGFTLFSSSTLFFKYLPSWLKKDISKLTWSVSTSAFDNTVLRGLPLAVDHPTTGKPCLRYHEPWPQSKTRFDASDVTIDGLESTESAAVCETIDSVLYDRRVALYYAWDKGDILVSDNILMMHTRSDFTAGVDRELWRIHFD